MKVKDFKPGAAILYSRPCGYKQFDTFPGTVISTTNKKVKIKYSGWDASGKDADNIKAAVSPESLTLQ